MHAKHLIPMAIGGAVLLTALLLAGVPIAAAVAYAVILVCPLMMLGMALMMMRGRHHGHDAAAQPTDGAETFGGAGASSTSSLAK